MPRTACCSLCIDCFAERPIRGAVVIAALRVRYHGRGLVLTSIAYFLGQVIIYLFLWFGCCLAVYRC